MTNEKIPDSAALDSERRLTLLEMQVEALLAGRERTTTRIMKLREFIASNCPHDALEKGCKTCEFLMEDAAK